MDSARLAALTRNVVDDLSRLKDRWAKKPNAASAFHASDIAVDLGTATGLIYSDGSFGEIKVEDILSKTQSHIRHIRTLVSRRKKATGDLTKDELKRKYDQERGKATSSMVLEEDTLEADVEAVGHQAFLAWGRDPNLITEPVVRRGNVGDIAGYRSVFRHLIRAKYPTFKWHFEGVHPKPRILIGVPRNATTRHLQIVHGVIENDLKASPFLVWEQVAAAVGIRLPDGKSLPFRDAKSVAIADGGGGTFDFAVLNNGRVIHQDSYETAGDDIDEAIRSYMLRKYSLDIGYRTAIAIKEGIGSAVPGTKKEESQKHRVKGASFETEMPAEVLITRGEIRECITPVLQAIAGDFRRYLQSLQDYGEVHGDIKENGFFLTGGTSLLRGLDEYLAEQTGLQIHRVENPLTSVIDGLITMMSNDELLNLGLAA